MKILILTFSKSPDKGSKFGTIVNRDFNKIFISTQDYFQNFLTNYVQLVLKRDIFISEEPLFEVLKTIAIRSSLSKQKKKFLNRL